MGALGSNRSLVRQRGFTFIELLIVIAIIGVLGAVSIAQFSAYRQQGYDALASHDLGSVRIGQEAVFASTQEYVACVDAGCVTTIPGFRLSAAVSLTVTAVNGDEPSYSVTSTSISGTGEIFSYDSTAGP